jgi:hypothetical protein
VLDERGLFPVHGRSLAALARAGLESPSG